MRHNRKITKLNPEKPNQRKRIIPFFDRNKDVGLRRFAGIIVISKGGRNNNVGEL